MKKFFTLCLAFMLALLYNANAAETGWNTYVSVSPAEGQAVPEWAAVFNGVEDGATYFNSVSYTITAPGADKMEVSVKKNNEEPWSMTLQPNQLPYGNGADEGVWEITATTWKNDESFSTKVNFTVEKVSSVYELKDFIGTTGKKRFQWENVYVLAQAGEYTYVKDFDRSILIHGHAPTFKAGDVFQEFIAEYHDNNGQHELIPYQFGQVFGNYPQQPEVITIQDVTVANQSKYVKIEDVVLDSKANTLGGIAYYNRFSTEIPVDGTYTITAIIGMNNGSVQLEPLTFEGFVIEPFTYTEIVPANNAEVPSLSEIKITFPYDVTYDATVAMGVLVMDGGNMITPTVAVEGAVATLTFDAITAYGSKPSLRVMEGAFKEATSGVGCQQFTAAWSIPTPPISYDLTLAKATPANGSTVDKLEKITLQISGDVYDCRYASQSYGNEFITVTDDKGNSYNGKIGYTNYTDKYYLYVENATASGTYTITIKEGVFGDEEYLKKYAKGLTNPEIILTYTIKSAALAAPTVSPANGAEIESPSTITLTFAEAVTVNAEAGAITLVRNSDASADKQDAVVTISEDGLTAILTFKPVYPSYEPKWYVGETYTMSIPAGYFVNASGAANEALSYSWKLVAPKFNVTKTTPEVGEVEQLDVIKIYFSEKVYLNNSNPINILNEAGEVATTATVKGNGAWVSEEVYESWIEATLAQPVTTPGQYTLVVPEGLAKNVNWGEGAINAAANLTYTVTGVVVNPNTYNFAWNVNPAEGTVSELKTIVFTAATAGQKLMPTDEAQVANWVKVTDQDGNVYNTTAKAETGYDVTIEGATAPGTYTVVVPKGSFYDFMASMSNPNSKNFNDEIVLTYTLKDAPAVEDFTPVVAPAAGDVTIEQIKTTVLSFESPIASFDDSDVRYAKNFGSVWCSVAGSYSIAEDKLSLTINWNFSPEVGLDYTLELPAGCIVLENGAKNLETRIDYTIVASIENGFTYETITPDPSQEVSSIESVVVTFPADVTYDNSLVMLGVNAMTLINTLTVTVEGNTVTFTPAVPITAEGSHQLTWNEGAFTAANGAKCAKATINYTVAKADPNTYNYELAADPANGSTLPALTTINFNDPSFATAAYLTDEAKNTPYWVVVEDAEGNMYNTTLDNTKGVTISVEGATAPGTYSVYVPAKTFYDMMAFSKDGKYNYNPEMRLTYIVKASPLATPTVSPANDTEVENLNTITLTFAEAVTANAEAGAISIVNTSDAGSDYAKEIRVAISEDGLTATITCVPGYLDRWAPGKTYKLNIPAGYFVATSGAASEAIEYSWTIATPKFTYVAVNPAQGEVTELSEILISFAQKTWGNGSNPTLNLVDANGNVVTTASTNREKDANGNWFAIKATLRDKVTTPGTYKLVVPADVFKDTDLGDGVTNAAFDLTWTVKEVEVDPNTYTLTLNTNPAQGEVTELFKISLSPAGGVFMILATAEAQTENWCKVTDANGNSYNSKIELSGQYYALTIEDATEEGEYTVVIPKKSFYDALNATNFNDEIVLKYEIVAPDNTIYDLAPIAISPANGSKVESLEKIHITFPYGTYDFLWATKEYGKDFIQVSDENGNTYEAKLGYGSYTEDYYIYVKNATALGKYTIVVPKGLVFDEEYSQTFESGHANPEFTLTYTIVAPQVDDFTPVVNPAAGNVTAEQIKTTVLSFESPIASFDNSDVRYAKPAFGSVWCSVAGRYTISEDKLSLTINWDFSPEVGLDYTLELPAGCIVLENGAKNLFTQVKYTVVGGPKDLAEFVVPEGINGYINYDETDVNAWAPEFPFTVSTSAINTIQFTAELPSLPAGITAMEVIDENGEVIATLNQDGVAPLADGEIYYVKGETTKEYADGAELKFRFRFTHLGVSETIQFSYKVAGGNITSIADVELDGNVIVRGNDIIAPQGAAIFTVSGIRVPAEGHAPGVYVVVLGNQAVKVMVK
ncbi:MAG: hypothetical protein J6V60_00150 [Muribaculaceae bacterium]|nr:hypothetical protein [Muribaculaceae bacterium]